MRLQATPWEVRAAAKRASTLEKIPPEWRLTPAQLAEAANQRDLTGPFIQKFLSAEDVAIVTKDSVEIVKDIKAKKLSALQVTTAFCKTAAVAHQIVRLGNDFAKTPLKTMLASSLLANNVTEQLSA
jgi:amidase